jgi:hypothetical protein
VTAWLKLRNPIIANILTSLQIQCANLSLGKRNDFFFLVVRKALGAGQLEAVDGGW